MKYDEKRNDNIRITVSGSEDSVDIEMPASQLTSELLSFISRVNDAADKMKFQGRYPPSISIHTHQTHTVFRWTDITDEMLQNEEK